MTTMRVMDGGWVCVWRKMSDLSLKGLKGGCRLTAEFRGPTKTKLPGRSNGKSTSRLASGTPSSIGCVPGD